MKILAGELTPNHCGHEMTVSWFGLSVTGVLQRIQTEFDYQEVGTFQDVHPAREITDRWIELTFWTGNPNSRMEAVLRTRHHAEVLIS